MIEIIMRVRAFTHSQLHWTQSPGPVDWVWGISIAMFIVVERRRRRHRFINVAVVDEFDDCVAGDH